MLFNYMNKKDKKDELYSIWILLKDKRHIIYHFFIWWTKARKWEIRYDSYL